MKCDLITDTTALLESLSRRAAELAQALPYLDLDPRVLLHLAGQIERIHGRLADLEDALAAAGPAGVLAGPQASAPGRG